MKRFETICLAAITLSLIFLIIELAGLARDLRKTLAITSGNVNGLVVTANAAAMEVRDASAQAKLAAIEQRAYWQKTSLETYKTMASLRLTIVRTNRSLNDEISPRLAAALDSTNQLSATAATELTRTMDQLAPTLENLAHASAGAAATMNDPAIHETLQHMDETSARAALTTAQAAQIAGHLNDASRDFAAYVHRITTPVRGTVNFLKSLLGIAAQARQAGGI